MENVLIADDHEITRRGLREIIQERLSDLNVFEVASGMEVLDVVDSHDIDLILLDIVMPGIPAIEVIEGVRGRRDDLPILVITALAGVESVVETMKAGANGLIHKHRASDELITAIQTVLNGEMYLHTETAIAIATDLHAHKPSLPHDQLSDRELVVFRGIAQGRSIKSIASDMKVSTKTVATYLARIKAKTGLSSDVEIARYALRNGLVD